VIIESSGTTQAVRRFLGSFDGLQCPEKCATGFASAFEMQARAGFAPAWPVVHVLD